jgi:hypothetical protein
MFKRNLNIQAVLNTTTQEYYSFNEVIKKIEERVTNKEKYETNRNIEKIYWEELRHFIFTSLCNHSKAWF